MYDYPTFENIIEDYSKEDDKNIAIFIENDENNEE